MPDNAEHKSSHYHLQKQYNIFERKTQMLHEWLSESNKAYN